MDKISLIEISIPQIVKKLMDEIIDNLNSLNESNVFVKTESESTQELNSDIVFLNNKRLLFKLRDTDIDCLSVKSTDGYENVNIGNSSVPLKFYHSTSDNNGNEVGKNPKISINDTQEDYIALISDIENFLTVENLENYYTKDNSFSKEEINTKIEEISNKITNLIVDNFTDYSGRTDKTLSVKAVQEYVQYYVYEMIGQITTMDMKVVEELPSEEISTTTIYLIKKDSQENTNIYNEFIYIDEKWEEIGNTQIDLSDYIKRNEIDSFNFATKTEIPTKITQLENDSNFVETKDMENYVSANSGKIDTISLNGTELPIENKNINIDLSNYPTNEELDKKLENIELSGSGIIVAEEEDLKTLSENSSKSIVVGNLVKALHYRTLTGSENPNTASIKGEFSGQIYIHTGNDYHKGDFIDLYQYYLLDLNDTSNGKWLKIIQDNNFAISTQRPIDGFTAEYVGQIYVYLESYSTSEGIQAYKPRTYICTNVNENTFTEIVNSENLETVLNYVNIESLNTHFKTIIESINEVNSIAKGANRAEVFTDYYSMINDERFYEITYSLSEIIEPPFNIGQNAMIITLNVPDLWISEIIFSEDLSMCDTTLREKTSSGELAPDTLDDYIKTLIDSQGYIEVGYYKLSALETQKVDLTVLENVVSSENSEDGTNYKITNIRNNTQNIFEYSTDNGNTYFKVLTQPLSVVEDSVIVVDTMGNQVATPLSNFMGGSSSSTRVLSSGQSLVDTVKNATHTEFTVGQLLFVDSEENIPLTYIYDYSEDTHTDYQFMDTETLLNDLTNGVQMGYFFIKILENLNNSSNSGASFDSYETMINTLNYAQMEEYSLNQVLTFNDSSKSLKIVKISTIQNPYTNGSGMVISDLDSYNVIQVGYFYLAYENSTIQYTNSIKLTDSNVEIYLSLNTSKEITLTSFQDVISLIGKNESNEIVLPITGFYNNASKNCILYKMRCDINDILNPQLEIFYIDSNFNLGQTYLDSNSIIVEHNSYMSVINDKEV